MEEGRERSSERALRLMEMLDAFVETQAGDCETDEAVQMRHGVQERVQKFEKAVSEGAEEPDTPVGVLFANVLDGIVQMWHRRQQDYEQERERERRLLQDKERRLLYPHDIQFSVQRTHR